jgi:hypothetical protein
MDVEGPKRKIPSTLKIPTPDSGLPTIDSVVPNVIGASLDS